MIVDLRAGAARPTTRFRSHSLRVALAVVIGSFILSRMLYYALGVRFDASPLDSYYQLIDPLLLKTRLAESIFYLRDQPPLFNFFCGLVLKLAPSHPAALFGSAYLAMGLAWSVGLLLLLRRLGVTPLLATGLTLFLLASPTTVLYENWLIYEYPLLALLVLAALFLHRFVAERRAIDGFALFSLLAAVVLLRGTFHLLWFAIILAAIMLARRSSALRTLRLAAIPLLVLLAVFVKNWVVFGDWVTGSIYRKFNLAVMTIGRVPYAERVWLGRTGELTPASVTTFFDRDATEFTHVAPLGPPTGIPVLDEARKSTGYPNWNHRAMPAIADAYEHDALYLLTHRPGTYFASVASNTRRYFLPAHECYPFHRGGNHNHIALESLLNAVDVFPALQWRDYQPAWGAVALFPLLVAWAALGSAGPRKLRTALLPGCDTPAARAVIAFCLFNILYVTATTILLSYADHNRYRFAIMPLYTVLAAVAVSSTARALAARRVTMRPDIARTDHADADLTSRPDRGRREQAQADSGVHRPREHAHQHDQHRPHEKPARLGRTRPDP